MSNNGCWARSHGHPPGADRKLKPIKNIHVMRVCVYKNTYMKYKNVCVKLARLRQVTVTPLQRPAQR